MDPIKTNIAGIFEPTQQYVIPLFQRHYVWNEQEQWRPLWEDIIAKAAKRTVGESRRDKLQPHFTGAIVIQQKKTNTNQVPVYEIIDGQQRLTTFQAILCAVRDVCEEDKSADFLAIAADAKKYLFNTGRHAHGDGKFKLMPTEYDKAAFKTVVNGVSAGESGLIVNAYRYFKSEIQNFISGNKDKANALFDAVAEDFGLVSIQIDNEDEPELIFESLNARGKPLMAFDLLRNNLFLRTRQSAGEDRDALYKQYWRHFETPFWEQSVGAGRRKTTLSELFLQHFLSAKLATDNVEPLFHTYQKEYRKNLSDDTQTTESELTELHRYSGFYKCIAIPGDDSELGKAMQVYHFLNITTLRPFVLYLVAEAGLSGKWLRHALHAIEAYTMRRMICTTQKHKNFNKFFPELIKKLQETGGSVPAIIEFLQDEKPDTNKWPRDEDVSNALSGHWGNIGVSAKQMRYILRRMELHMRQDNRFNEGDDPLLNLTLEHVLPQMWEATWPLPSSRGPVKWENIFSPEHKDQYPVWNDYCPPEEMESALADEEYKTALAVAKERQDLMWSIGNLTLLTSQLNASESNLPFHEKKKLMDEHSTLLLNNDIRRETNWDVAEIKNRTKRLHGLFCKIWPDPRWFLDNMPPE